MRRFTGDGPQPTRLDEILFDDLPSLTEARRAEDARIVAYVDGLSGADLAGTFSYRTITSPADITQKLAPALAHFFNHQTHHRGQAHTLLTIAGGRDAAPPLDLIYFQRETGSGSAEPDPNSAYMSRRLSFAFMTRFTMRPKSRSRARRSCRAAELCASSRASFR